MARTLQVMLEVVAQAVGMLFVHMGDDALLDSIIGRRHGCRWKDSYYREDIIFEYVLR